jgi:hypothetical protein
MGGIEKRESSDFPARSDSCFSRPGCMSATTASQLVGLCCVEARYEVTGRAGDDLASHIPSQLSELRDAPASCGAAIVHPRSNRLSQPLRSFLFG